MSFQQNEVSFAKNLLSRKIGAAIQYLIEEEIISKEASATALQQKFCNQIGVWYDTMHAWKGNIIL